MIPAGRRKEKGICKPNSGKTRRKMISKKRPASQGAGNWRMDISYLPKFKFLRFFSLRELHFRRPRKGKKEQQRVVELVNKMAPMNEPEEGSATTCFWRDPDAEFCIICGDDKEKHLELMCPYNYLSPRAYAPCRARLALWGNYTTTLRHKCLKHKEEEQTDAPRHDETNSRRLGFLRYLVRVNNMPERCHPEQLVALFSQFGRLRMWHVATSKSWACKGFGCIVFQNGEHADEAIEALNCCEFGGRKLRVDWAYPCLHC